MLDDLAQFARSASFFSRSRANKKIAQKWSAIRIAYAVPERMCARAPETFLMKTTIKFLSARVPAELVAKLEDHRHRVSKRSGKRVSTRNIVETAVRHYLRNADAK